MRACDDGYPSCRNAEAGGIFCKNGCSSTMFREIAAETKKKDLLTEKFIIFCKTQGHSRARTTTYNANVGRIAERIDFLKKEQKKTEGRD